MTKMPCIFNMSEHKLLLYLIFYLFSFIHYLTSDIFHNIPSGLASYWFSRKAVFFTNRKKYALIKLKQTSLKIISRVQWLIFNRKSGMT